uniref:Nuclear receptor domain-containing protein n=1 Tax=Rhabditophanes sp. KR3021 TaxID=114890 RepID=A0AC35UBQ9_9BILA
MPVSLSTESNCLSEMESVCAICGEPYSGGIRNKNIICRACQVFAKRSLISNAVYLCRRRDKLCWQDVKRIRKCRYCRLKKCKDVGISFRGCEKYIDQVVPEDPPRTSVIQPTYDIEPSANLPSTSVSNHSSGDMKLNVTWNFQPVKQLIFEIFNGPLIEIANPHQIYLNCLQRTSLALDDFFSKWDYHEKDPSKYSKKIEHRMHLEQKNKEFILFAELLQTFPEFARLQCSDKIQLFRQFCNNIPLINLCSNFSMFWPIFSTLSQVKMAIDMFGVHPDNSNLILNKDTILDLKTASELKTLIFCDLPQDVSDLISPVYKFLLNNIYKPFQRLNPDRLEFAFLTLHMLWTPKRSVLNTHPSLITSDKLLKICATELHNHYQYQAATGENYAYRLTELIKLIAVASDFSVMQRETVLAGRIFGIFEKSGVCSAGCSEDVNDPCSPGDYKHSIPNI